MKEARPSSDFAQGSTLIPTLALNPEWATLSEDVRINPDGLTLFMELPAGDPEVTMLSAG